MFDSIIERIPILRKLAANGQLILYADDMAIHFENDTELRNIINGLTQMQTWGLQINRVKSQIMLNEYYKAEIY